MKLIRYILLIAAALLLIGCSTQREVTKHKEETAIDKDKTTNTQTFTERYRDGGEIATHILPEKYRERDENGNIKELIQTLRDGALTKTIIYKPDGSVDVDCTADAIFERVLQRQQEYEQTKTQTETQNKETQKETVFSKINILFVFVGLVLLVILFKKL